MKNDFNIQEAHPNKLFLIWLFLHSYKNTLGTNHFGDDFFYFMYDEIDKIIYDLKVNNIIHEIFEDGIIEEIQYIRYKKKEERSHDEELEDKTYSYSLKPKKKKGIISIKDYSHFKGSYICYLGIKIDPSKAQSYIEEYLLKWKNNDLYFQDENMLKKENQISNVVKKIYEIEKRYSYKNMLVNSPEKEEFGIDFVATVLFLESIGSIEVNGFIQKEINASYLNNVYKNLFFRITLKDKFFQDFTESKNKIHFDFEEICKQNKKRKIIYYDQPYKLICEGKEHRINKGKLPFEIINRAFEDKKIVSVNIESLCKDIAMKESDFKKNIENFRAKLREKFGFKEDENFFDIDNGEILLKGSIFQLKEKKV